MIIETSAGTYTLTRNPNHTGKIRVTANSDGAMRSIFYALKLSGVEDGFSLPELNDDQTQTVELSEGTVAIWVQFEVLNYVDYTTFKRETQNETFMAANRGTVTWNSRLSTDVL